MLLAGGALAQFKVQGTVYDSSRTFPIEEVSVLASNGKGTTTNAAGAYSLIVSEKDSIWFSYLGKPTIKFPVAKIADPTQFDLALQVPVKMLKEVKVTPRNYKLDSIQNRIDYAKAFDFHRPNVESMTSIGSNGAGIDINELIRLFQFRKNRSMLRFQERLLNEEREKFIDHRFNKTLIRRLTGLEGAALSEFALRFRPSYEMALYASDYELGIYIKEAAKLFTKTRGF